MSEVGINKTVQGYWDEGFLTVQHALNIVLGEKFRGVEGTNAPTKDNLIMVNSFESEKI